jgi:hypothetical protein
MLLLAPAAPTIATAADAAVASAEEEVVLDEVLVRGKRLERIIVDAEDAFYRLYNELNKDDDYDVNCAYVNADAANPGSRITSRVCLPGFVADAVVDWTLFKMICQPPLEGIDEFDCLDKNNDNRLSQQEIAARPDLWASIDNGYITRRDWPIFYESPQATRPAAHYQPPSPTLVLMEGTKAWYEHMLQTTRSDPRLLEMAGRLDELHAEYMTLQRQEAEMRTQYFEERAQRVGRISRGPRGR